MEAKFVEISVKGHATQVPFIQIEDRIIVVTGRWLRIAGVKDEAWLEGESVNDPETCVAKINQEKLADLFTFAQKIPHTKPIYSYHLEWDNVAAICTSDFSHWWENLPQEARKNVRRAGKRRITVRKVQFDDLLLRDIVDINNETPTRQDRPFWHYGKSFDIVRKDYATLLDRSEFIGAYYEDKLVGFIKMVYMGEIAGILQLLCMNKHSDKRPANALIAKAVEICSAQGVSYLTYGKYIYGKNTTSPLTEFKRRNGFEQVNVPRYYIPLTRKGKIGMRIGLHHTLKELLPRQVLDIAINLRSKWHEKKY